MFISFHCAETHKAIDLGRINSKSKKSKMKNFKVVLVLLLQFSIFSAFAQFMTPLSSISGPAFVTKVNGDTLSGDLKNAMSGPNGIVSFKIEKADGTSEKIKTADVKELKIKIDGLARIEMVANAEIHLTKPEKNNLEQIGTREYILWEQVKHYKKDKFLLLQLINPDFDDKIKVYAVPVPSSSEITNDNISYYVVKDGVTKKMSNKDYKKGGYAELFSDCPAMNKKKPKIADLAQDILEYNDCK